MEDRVVSTSFKAFLAISTFPLFYFAAAEITHATDVTVAVDRKFISDGTYGCKIFERGTGPTGKYTRSYSFRAKVVQGVVLPTALQEYVAVMETERAGVWRTHREPTAGFLFLFWEGKRLRVDMELLEAWDRHPVRMPINGIHDVTQGFSSDHAW